MELVFVYLGTRVPTYLEKNLALLSRQFPDYSIVLLSDNLREIDRLRVEIPEIKGVLVSNPEISWAKTLSTSKYSQKFRENFWGKTLARFYSIYEYMTLHPQQEILHVEADVWLSPNFPLDKFKGLSRPLAYPLTNVDQGVASTVYFRDLDAANLLKSFSESVMTLDPFTTDVSVLGELYRVHPNEVLILPTAPSYNFPFHTHANAETKIDMSRNFSQFGGIFDASTWGQYLTGEDPRNNVGIKTVYHHQEHHAVCPRDVFYRYTAESRLLGTHQGFQFEIFSLHVHSKNVDIFTEHKNKDVIKSYCDNYNGKEKREYYLKIFFRQLFPFLIYRLKVKTKKILGFCK